LAPGSKLKSLYPLTPLSVSICHSNLPALRVDERFSFRWTSADRSRRRPHDITSRQIANLPLTGYRNYQSLIDLVPGATPSRFQNAHIDSPQRSLTTNINRTSRNSNNTRIDGATSVFPYLPHHTRYVPPAESIETVNVATNRFDAEQGMAGGAAINVITKSGTNEIHGSLFEFHNDNQMAARNFFWRENRRPKRIQNQFGGTISGPIVKGKLFYFGSYEGMRQRQDYSANVTVTASGTTLNAPFNTQVADQVKSQAQILGGTGTAIPTSTPPSLHPSPRNDSAMPDAMLCVVPAWSIWMPVSSERSNRPRESVCSSVRRR
jgi:hypothetical protein